MRKVAVLRILCCIGGAGLLLPVLTLLFVPAADIKGAIVRGMGRNGYVLRTEEFSKSFPFGIKARNVLLSDERGTLLKLDQASVHLKFFPLFIGRFVLDFKARIGGGEARADYETRTSSWSVHCKGVRLEDIPLIPTVTGAKVKGRLSVDGSLEGSGSRSWGEVKLEVSGAELSAIKIGELPLPDAYYSTIRGMFRINVGKGTLESLTFQGDGIYSRLSGTLPVSGPLAKAPLDLTLELMPKPDFLERQKFVFLLLDKYQASPGSYKIPIKGVLMKPEIP